MVFVVAIALTFSVYYFSSISLVSIRTDNQQKTQEALSQAKHALLNYAILRADLTDPSIQLGKYGYLPCPANDNGEGNSVGVCGAARENALGWFPWRSLGLPPLKDGSGDCLLYAVSSSYKFNPMAGMLNEDTNGMFQIVDEAGLTVTGAVPEDRVLAVVFSAGGALAGQNRIYNANSECGDDINNFSAYLDVIGGIADNSMITTGIEDVVDQFVKADAVANNNVINDHFITISRDEVWQTMMSRSDINESLRQVTEAVALCIAEYVNDASNVNKRFPWPATLNIAGAGGDYRVMSDYSDVLNAAEGYAGRFPFHVDNSNAAIAGGVNDLLVSDAICNDLDISAAGVPNVNLTDITLLHRRILDNWKDHFFYAVSKKYALQDGVPPTAAHTGCSLPAAGDCISVNGTEYAAVVFFGNSPYRDAPEFQSRNIADKLNISNYLENGNDLKFTDVGGDAAYNPVNPVTSNDIMFCLTDSANPAVVPCSP